jgi:lysophospholipase L1-like esterase
VVACGVAGLVVAGCVEIRIPDHAVRYVAFGDSATAEETADGYPEILRMLLDEPREAFANEGISGETSEEGLVRLELLLTDGIYPSAELLLYWEGGNDITEFISEHDRFLLYSPDAPDYPLAEELAEQLDRSQANIESAIAAAQRKGFSVFVATYYFMRESIGICDALPLNLLLPPQAVNANGYVARLNERIRAATVNQGAILVDVASEDGLIRSNADNYVDCNHLSGQGNTIVADLFFDAIVASW